MEVVADAVAEWIAGARAAAERALARTFCGRVRGPVQHFAAAADIPCMGRQARIKKDRARRRAEAPDAGPDAAPDAAPEPESRTRTDAAGGGQVILTMALPGAEHLAGADGLFDDCEICQRLRRGETREARQRIRQEEKRQEWARRRAAN